MSQSALVPVPSPQKLRAKFWKRWYWAMCSALLATTVKSWLMRGGQLPAQVEANFAALIAQGVLQPI